jgi:hypothetical protein
MGVSFLIGGLPIGGPVLFVAEHQLISDFGDACENLAAGKAAVL